MMANGREAHGHHQQTLHGQSGNHYSRLVPSNSAGTSIGMNYGPHPPQSFAAGSGVPSSNVNVDGNTNSGQFFSHPNQSSPMSQFLSPTDSSYIYNTNPGINGAAPWNENLYPSSGSNNHAISSPNNVASISPPQTGPSNRALPPRSAHPFATSPSVNLSHTNNNARITNVSTRRNLLPRNPCADVARSASRNINNSPSVPSEMGVNALNNESHSVNACPIPASRRRSRRSRLSATPATSNLDATPPPSTRKSVTRSRTTKRKQDQKKIPPVASNEQCPICLDVPQKNEVACVNGCSHTFCFHCIEKWSDRENTCPLCKARFTKIDRVNKPPPKKRKKGDTPRAKNTKKVKNRDQRADIGIANPLQGLLATMNMNSDFPHALTQLLLRPQIMIRSSPSSNSNSRRLLQSYSNSRSRSNTTELTLDWINSQQSTNQPRRRSARLENMGHRQGSETNTRGGRAENANRSALRGAQEIFNPFQPIEQIDPLETRVRNLIFDRSNFVLNGNGVFNETSDDDSDTDYNSLFTHLNQSFDVPTRNGNDGGMNGQQNRHIDPEFYVRHAQNSSSNNDAQSHQVTRSYALNLRGGETADTALEIQDSDDEVEIADENGVEIEVLVD